MGKKIKVVFDTNIWISILLQNILHKEYAQTKQDITVYASNDILLEISKVLQYPKIAKILEKNSIHQKNVLRAITSECQIVEPKEQLHIIMEDESDNKILECAQAAGADIIVSGDKHLLNLGKYKNIKILTARAFFDSQT